MEKIKIDPFDYAKEICEAVSRGVLLNAQADGRFNTMTIGWGTIGREFNEPVFTIYVRTSRFTHTLLEKNPEFTVSIPVKGKGDAATMADPEIRKILGVAGTRSGRAMEKAKDLSLTLVDSEVNSVPAIAEFPLTLECRVIWQGEQEKSAIAEEERTAFYPDIDDVNAGGNCYPHTIYYGKIEAAYIIK